MQPRIVIHTGTFRHEGVDLAFTRWEAEDPCLFDAEYAAGGRVPLVLLHGFAQSAGTWDEVAPSLAEGFGAVYALDFVGHGVSERPSDATRYSMEVVCAGVRDFCTWIGRREGAAPVLVGYSMGGRVALETLVRAGAGCWDGVIAGLVLESAGLGPIDDAARETFRLRNESWAQQLRDQGVSAFMDYWEALPLFKTQRLLPREAREKLRAGRLDNDAEALARTFAGTGQHHQHAEGETLQALSAASEAGLPVLYIAGSLDEKYAAVAQRLAGACPRVVVREVPEAGHSVHLENPLAFTQTLSSHF